MVTTPTSTISSTASSVGSATRVFMRRSTAPRRHARCCGRRPFSQGQLDAQLDDATRQFVGDARNVSVGDGKIELNAIFEWYREDFEAHAKPWGGALLDFVEHYLDDVRAAEMRRAREAGHPVAFTDYDWSLNGSGAHADG